MLRYAVLLLVLSLYTLSGCKKKAEEITPPVDPLANVDQTLLDTYDLCLEWYLWYQNLPAKEEYNFKTNNTIPKILEDIKQYSDSLQDRFSFAILQSVWDSVTSSSSTDWGVSFSFSSDETFVVPRYVRPNSEARQKGLRRGTKITAINGINADSSNIDALNSALSESTSLRLTIETRTTANVVTSTDITLGGGAYPRTVVLYDTVLETKTTSGEDVKAGYFHLETFNLDNSEQEIVDVFSTFRSEGVENVIVDLRYNGGGLVSLAIFLANHLVCPTYDKTKMLTLELNDKKSNLNETAFFAAATSTICPKSLYFIVSDNTASASELLMTVLEPHLNYKIIGSDRTVGKFTGFFPLEVPNSDYLIFPTSFRYVNGTGQGKIGGFVPSLLIDDDVENDWPNEMSVRAALDDIAGVITIPSAYYVPPAGALLSVEEDKMKGIMVLDKPIAPIGN